MIHSGVEGPYAYKDNLVMGKVTLLLDYYGSDGYRLFTPTNLNDNAWANADRTNLPTNLRHRSVVGVTQESYDAFKAK